MRTFRHENTSHAVLIGDLNRFIRDRTDRVLLRCNPGNAGDALIAAGTFRFLEKNDIPYRIVGRHERFGKNDVLWYGGGGNLVTYYSDCKKWLLEYAGIHRCIVLPHTINDVSLLKQLPPETTLICREKESFVICTKHCHCNVALHQDMSFYLKPEYVGVEPITGSGVLNAFRCDIEKTAMHRTESSDISVMFRFNPVIRQSILDCAANFLNRINTYEVIHTDRLHVAIGGYLLNKRVYLYKNSYFKNRAVYKFSLNGGDVRYTDGGGESAKEKETVN